LFPDLSASFAGDKNADIFDDFANFEEMKNFLSNPNPFDATCNSNNDVSPTEDSRLMLIPLPHRFQANKALDTVPSLPVTPNLLEQFRALVLGGASAIVVPTVKNVFRRKVYKKCAPKSTVKPKTQSRLKRKQRFDHNRKDDLPIFFSDASETEN